MSSAKRLALTRIVVCVALIVTSLTENASALAWLPASMRTSMGFVDLIPLTISHSPVIWTLFDILVPLALCVALLGYRTRLSLLIAACAQFIEAGLIHAYSYFYHTGVVPLVMAFLLALTPCGDVWSLDARWRKIKPRSEEVYRWALVLAWSPLVLTYLTAGLNKVRYGGINWIRPGNLQEYIAQSQYHSPPPLVYAFTWINSVPKVIWSFSAAMAIFSELGYLSVLWSRRARWVFPLLALMIHAVSWVLMGICFPDMFILQAAVFPVEYLWSYATKFFSRSSSSFSPSSG